MMDRPAVVVVVIIAVLLAVASVSSSPQSSSSPTNREKNKGRHGQRGARDRDAAASVYDGVCDLEISCRGGDEANLSMPVRLPIKGPRGPAGRPGDKGDRGHDGLPGFHGAPGLPAPSQKKVAFFAGLTQNFGPVQEHTDIVLDRVITNIGSGYSPSTGRFTAPVNGVYQFNVIVSAQGRQKAAVMILKNGEMVATVWAESIPYWATSSNIAVLSLDRGDQVWLLLLTRASYLHGFMYTTFSGFIVFEH